MPRYVREHDLDSGRPQPGRCLHPVVRRGLHDVQPRFAGRDRLPVSDGVLRREIAWYGFQICRRRENSSPFGYDHRSARARDGERYPGEDQGGLVRDGAGSVKSEPQGFRACILVLEIFGAIQSTGKPVLYLGDNAVYATVELDARPPKATRVETCLFEAISEIVVVGLLAAVLQ